MALIDKASLLFVPSVVAEGKAFNILPSGNRAPDSTDQNSGYDQTRADFDFDRGSNAAATRIGSDGLIKKYRENLILQSNNFGVGPWANAGTTDTSGQEGYDGTNNAWLITKASANGRMEQSVSSTGVSTLSVYAKANDSDWVLIQHIGGSNPYAFFNISTGEKGAIGGAIDSKIESVGNGWYRLSIVSSVAITQVRIYPAEVNTTSATSGSIFIQSAQLEKGLVATDYLDSTSVTGKAGVLVDLPRINYDANGQNGALLLEPSRVNGFAQSEYFKGLMTTDVDITIDINASTSPEGLQNASRLNFNAASRSMYRAVNFAGEHTYSFYVKAEGSNIGKTFDFRIRNTGGGDVNHDVPLTGEWVRHDFQFSDANLIEFTNRSSTTIGTGGFLLWGIQIEAGSYVSSYIPTMGTSETRAGDLCTGGGSASTFNDSEGVLYAEISTLSLADTSERKITISNTSNNSYLRIQYGGTPGTIYLFVYINGVKVADIRKASLDTTNKHKVAIRYGSAGYSGFVDGVLIETDAYAGNFVSYPLNSLDFFQWKGDIKQISVFDTALTDAECITLTTL